MDVFSDLKIIFDKDNEFIVSKNSYFETHNCNGKNIKVPFDYVVTNERTGEEIVFGKCKECNKVFYNVN